MSILLADSGATKCEWCLVDNRRKLTPVFTQGMSPYFLTIPQIESILRNELLPHLPSTPVDQIYYYGSGCASAANARLIRKAILQVFPRAEVQVTVDVMGAARALCGHHKGIACILGTGSNSCYYNGKKIVKNSPGLGYVLGDEGSGAFLGRKVIQYYLYHTFDEELSTRFTLKYPLTPEEILDHVYKKPLPNRFLASFSVFLSENRGHYMVENILEDGLNDFFFTHLDKYPESRKYPVHFVGGVAFAFQDVIRQLCRNYDFELGRILKNPMQGLLEYHRKK